jgi:hypothetical protein
VKSARTAQLLGTVLALGMVACSSEEHAHSWVPTGSQAAFPAPLSVDQATAITIDATYMYWITTGGFLCRAPRSGGAVERVPLPATGVLLGAHNDVFVGWTDTGGNAQIADIDPATGTVLAMNELPGVLRGLVAGQHGYSFASGAAGVTRVQTCLNGVCAPTVEIASEFKSLALDLPTKTYHVLTADGLRTCTLSDGCPTDAATIPAASSLIASLPGTYFVVDANGQAFGTDSSSPLGSPAVVNPTKLMVVDGNGHTTSPVGTWSNGTALAQALLAPGESTSELAEACTDFDVDATGRPLYCLDGSSSIRVIP